MDLVKELFGTEDLYEVLAISKEKADDEKSLHTAYLKAAFKFHPDKAPVEDRKEYTKKFQLIQKIYELLQDKDLKKSYDETGTWPDDDKIEVDLAFFGRLDVNAISEFKKMYQGSEEERQDIKKYYEQGQGDIFHICDNVFCLNVLVDKERVESICEDLIKKGEMKRMTKGVKGAKATERKMNRARKEAEEAEQMMKEIKKAHAERSKSGKGFLDTLAAKYGGAAANSKRNAGKKKGDAGIDVGPSKKKSKKNEGNAGKAGSTRSSRK